MPTQLAGSPWQTVWTTNTTPKLAPTASTFAASTGDWIVVIANASDAATTLSVAPSNAAGTSPATISWTTGDNVGSAASSTRAASWWGQVTAGGNVQVSVPRAGTANNYGATVWAFDGTTVTSIGQHRASNVNSPTVNAPSLAPSAPWTAHSFVCVVDGDWSAAVITSRAYVANLDTATEDNAINDDSSSSIYSWHHADSGASPASLAVGMSAPSQTWSLAFVEVTGSTAAAVSAPVLRRGTFGM